ncbi:MAG: hypothetical protein K5840_04950 [Eubacterium sp.]|nr:hypothetical protein [Eubacterium sp.]
MEDQNMEELRQQQKEALITTHEYIQKLFDAIPKVNNELRGQMLDDTEEYLNAILNGVNFVTEVFNRTMDYVNADEVLVDKEKLNEYVLRFMAEYKNGSKAAIADSLENDILVYLQSFDEAIQKTCY